MDLFVFLSRFLITPSRFGETWVAFVALLRGKRGTRKSMRDGFRLKGLDGECLAIKLKYPESKLTTGRD